MPRHPNSLANLRPPFQPGERVPGAGRPPGSRAKLNEFALRALLEDFTQHGVAVIAKVREKRPEAYLAAVVGLLPRQAQKLDSPFTDLSDDELEQLEQLLAAMRAKTVRDLNRVAPKPKPNNNVPNVTASLGLQPLQYPAAQAWRATTNAAVAEEASEQTRPNEACEQEQSEEASGLGSEAKAEGSLGEGREGHATYPQHAAD